VRNKNNLFKYFVLFLILLSSCTKNTDDPVAIASSISVAYAVSSEIPLGNPVDITLTNETRHCIVFPVVDGVSMWAEQNGGQVVVENLVTSIGSQDLILYPQGELLSARILPLRPNTSNLVIDAPIKFTVQLTGYLCEDKNVQIQKQIIFTIIP
jgi:hypothetical protein